MSKMQVGNYEYPLDMRLPKGSKQIKDKSAKNDQFMPKLREMLNTLDLIMKCRDKTSGAFLDMRIVLGSVTKTQAAALKSKLNNIGHGVTAAIFRSQQHLIKNIVKGGSSTIYVNVNGFNEGILNVGAMKAAAQACDELNKGLKNISSIIKKGGGASKKAKPMFMLNAIGDSVVDNIMQKISAQNAVNASVLESIVNNLTRPDMIRVLSIGDKLLKLDKFAQIRADARYTNIIGNALHYYMKGEKGNIIIALKGTANRQNYIVNVASNPQMKALCTEFLREIRAANSRADIGSRQLGVSSDFSAAKEDVKKIIDRVLAQNPSATVNDYVRERANENINIENAKQVRYQGVLMSDGTNAYVAAQAALKRREEKNKKAVKRNRKNGIINPAGEDKFDISQDPSVSPFHNSATSVLGTSTGREIAIQAIESNTTNLKYIKTWLDGVEGSALDRVLKYCATIESFKFTAAPYQAP